MTLDPGDPLAAHAVRAIQMLGSTILTATEPTAVGNAVSFVARPLPNTSGGLSQNQGDTLK